jgi:hypothetical protein
MIFLSTELLTSSVTASQPKQGPNSYLSSNLTNSNRSILMDPNFTSLACSAPTTGSTRLFHPVAHPALKVGGEPHSVVGCLPQGALDRGGECVTAAIRPGCGGLRAMSRDGRKSDRCMRAVLVLVGCGWLLRGAWEAHAHLHPGVCTAACASAASETPAGRWHSCAGASFLSICSTAADSRCDAACAAALLVIQCSCSAIGSGGCMINMHHYHWHTH